MPEFSDAHGVAIVYDVHLARTEPRGVVQLLHGVGEHAGRYGDLIAALTDDGYTVYADDHRGHGRTGLRQHGDPRMLGRLGRGGHQAVVDALWRFTQLIRDDNPGLPLILLGHSWGSFLAQKLVNAHPTAYDGLVLSGSALAWPASLNASPLNQPWDGPDANGVEWLATDPQVQADFLDDPLTTTASLLKLFGVWNTLRMLGRPRRGLARDLPTLIMVGGDDTVGGPRSNHRLADAYRRRAGFSDVTTLVYPGIRHEIFNDVTQAEVRADLRAWLDARFPVRV